MDVRFMRALTIYMEHLQAAEKALEAMRGESNTTPVPYLGSIPVLYEGETVGLLDDVTDAGDWIYVPGTA